MAPTGYTTGGSGSRRQASPSIGFTDSGTAAASALADMFSPPKPHSPIPSPTSTVGQGAAERFEESLQEPLSNEQVLEIVKSLRAVHDYSE